MSLTKQSFSALYRVWRKISFLILTNLVLFVYSHGQACSCEATHDFAGTTWVDSVPLSDNLTILDKNYVYADPGTGNSVSYTNVDFDGNANSYVAIHIKSGTVTLDLDVQSNNNGIKKIEVDPGATLILNTANNTSIWNKVQLINNGIIDVYAGGGVTGTVGLWNIDNWLYNNALIRFHVRELDVRDGSKYTNSGLFQIMNNGGSDGILKFSNTGKLCLNNGSILDVEGYVTANLTDLLEYYGPTTGNACVRIDGSGGAEIRGQINNLQQTGNYDQTIFFKDPTQNLNVCTPDAILTQAKQVNPPADIPVADCDIPGATCADVPNITELTIDFTLVKTDPSCTNNDGAFSYTGLTPGQEYSLSYIDPLSNLVSFTGTADASGVITVSGLSGGDYTAATAGIGCRSDVEDTVKLVAAPSVEPTITIAASKNPVCSGENVNFTIFAQSDEGTSPTYQWKLNGGNVGTGTTYSNASLANGDKITVDLTSNVSCVLPATVTSNEITIAVNPDPIADAGSDDDFCLGQGSVTLGATGGGTYSWSPTTGLSDPGISNPIATPGVNTTYTVTVTDDNGCTDTDDVIITVNGLPTADAGTDDDFCLGQGGATLGATGGGTYSWSPTTALSDPLISNPVATPVLNTTYTVTITDDNGCTGSDDVLITVNAPPNVVAGNDTSICIGSSITLNGGGAISYTWDNAVSDGIAFSPGLGAVTYQLTGLDANGCSATDDVLVTVNDLPDFTLNFSNPSFCGGSDGSFTINGLFLNTNYDVAFNSGSPSMEMTNGIGEITLNGLSASSYTNILVTDLVTSCSATDAVGVTLSDPSAPTVTAGNDTSICENSSITLTANNPDGATITWDNSVTDGLAFKPVLGLVTYIVTADLAGCTSTDAIEVEVTSLPSVFAGNDTSLCSGSSIALSGQGADSYVWDNGVTDGLSFTPTLGVVIYNVTGTDINGCVNSDDIQVSVNALGAGVASIPSTTCQNVDIDLALTGNAPGTVIQWQEGTDGINFSNALAGLQIENLLSSIDGDFYYRAVVSDGPCIDTSNIVSVSVILSEAAFVDAQLTGSGTLCTGDSYTIEVVDSSGSGNDPDFAWYINSTITPELSTSLTSNSFADGDTIVVEITSNAQCPAPMVAYDTVIISLTDKVTPSLSVSANQLSACANDSIYFTIDSHSGLGGANNFTWVGDGNVIGSLFSYPASALLGIDSVWVSVNSLLPCLTDTTTTSNKLGVQIRAAPNAEAGPSMQLNKPETISLNSNEYTTLTTPDAILYQWESSVDDSELDNLNPVNLSDPVHATPVAMQTWYKLTVGNGNCIDVDSMLVMINFEVWVPTGFTPNADGNNELLQIKNIEQFPDNKIVIYNRWGSIVYEGEGYDNVNVFWDGSFNNKKLPFGTYYYILTLEEGGGSTAGPITLVE